MRLLVAILVGLLLLSAFVRLRDRYWNRNTLITFFDVGQGDSALIQFPEGASVLIDAGGGFGGWNVGSAFLVGELARMGILSLDLAILSHPDQDHGYGFHGVLEDLSVQALWMPVDPDKKTLSRSLQSLAQLKSTRVVNVDHRKVWASGGVQLTVVPLRGETSNNRALVALLEVHECRVLFTGDIEEDSERSLPTDWAPIQILKVAHHGSRTSSSDNFLQRFQPKWAVISVGVRNSYGHPHPSVLERYRAHQIPLFRTDFHGYIQLEITPEGQILCTSFDGKCGTASCHR